MGYGPLLKICLEKFNLINEKSQNSLFYFLITKNTKKNLTEDTQESFSLEFLLYIFFCLTLLKRFSLNIFSRTMKKVKVLFQAYTRLLMDCSRICQNFTVDSAASANTDTWVSCKMALYVECAVYLSVCLIYRVGTTSPTATVYIGHTHKQTTRPTQSTILHETYM